MRLLRSLTALALVAAALPSALRADEGMWTFDNLPLKQLKDRYAFEPTQAWLDHVRLSAVHMGGCSASFVSPDGLVLTNHHCGRGSVQRLSTPKRDFIKEGFVARTQAEELPLPGLSWRTLMAMENVTERLAKALKPGLSEAEAAKARQNALDQFKAEAEKKSALSYDVVTLYQGGETWLYGYKKHTDIRLVLAPELQLALFGGNADNFTYPRHSLDFLLFRVYENGKPYKPAHHLTWGSEGLKEGDLTFVVGHPGSTARLQSYAQMVYDRDISLPRSLRSIEHSLEVLQEFAKRSPEHKRQVVAQMLNVENALKARRGYHSGLLDPAALARLEKAEAALKTEVGKRTELKATLTSWEAISKALAEQEGFAKEAQVMGACGASNTLGNALTIVRLLEQKGLPSAERLQGYSDSAIEAQIKRLTAPATSPYNSELEALQFTRGLEEAQQVLGAEHPFVKTLLGGQKAEARALQLVGATQMQLPETRKLLLEGGLKASGDPVLALARAIEPQLRDLRRKQDGVAALLSEHSARIARARFAVYGKETYPDATSSLRISFGPVSTYPANGTLQQPFTTLMGLFDRHLGWGGNASKAEEGAWHLPQRWIERMDKLDLKTPYNFAHAADIIGGNSGSPVVNRKGELVGLIFDGNIESLPGRYYYDGTVNRAISVDVRAIVEAMIKVYDAPHLAKEVLGK